MSDGGKGSAPRPYSVDQKTFGNNWDRIFGKKDPTPTQPNTAPVNNEVHSNNT